VRVTPEEWTEAAEGGEEEGAAWANAARAERKTVFDARQAKLDATIALLTNKVEQTVARDDPDPKALACYGLLVRDWDAAGVRDERLWLRFVDGRPVSAITTQFLVWCCDRLAARGKTALLLVWDNASWHLSKEVRGWIGEHNRAVKQEKAWVRIVVCPLPSKSPWLNPIEPKWVHGKRWIVEPAHLLTADEIAGRVCAAFGCLHEPHLTLHEEVS